ncbi:hypothetical protein KDU71_03465 [Carboxylicivirga sediminis]|uniref:Uncharacterized protein n=1 Tax=Carboxylicivirga sediminis TaxID=2006564 RepID=A0A941F3F1_9BACT|nr:hypothetical protein [Carboxylicivirga sediminis]MBR8534605.1 hypothetical protein [Carboxylicivirga sediminis]
MIKRLLAVLIFVSVGAQLIKGQGRFSGQAELFVNEMEEVFKGATDKKAAKEFIEAFEIFWMGQEDELKGLMIETCNLMAKKKARPYPDYNTYLSTIMAFKTSEHPAESFKNWHQAVSDLLNQPRYALRHLKSFLVISKNLVENNAVYTTPALTWYARSGEFNYEYTNEELSLHVGTTDLVCVSKRDSIVIFNTSGILYPLEKKWLGRKGRVTWERCGFDANIVYATFDGYQVEMDKPSFEIDSVEFYNRHYFDYPLHGSLEHKVMQITSPGTTIYPKFVTTEQRFRIDKIHPNIDYEGGFAQNGAKFLGAGTHENPATITISRNDTTFITAKSLYFALRKDQVLSNDTEVSIVMDRGFIYHPGLIFKYMADLEEIHLIRNGEGLALSPYFDTFHNISMDVELIRWKIGAQFMDLRMLTGAAQNQAFFESLSYFREDFYNQLQGMDAIHPLQGLRNCSNYFHGQVFTAAEYAKFMGFPESPVRQQLIQLSFYGFIGYNVNTDEITIRQRLNDYIDFRLGKKDYDVIRFTSLTDSEITNARLDLLNFDLNLNGVETISICDHQNVVFFPRNQSIILKENRNFVFNGTINAGMLTLSGDGFKFLYDDFRIDMSNIDSLKMKVESGDKDYFGLPVLKDVGNTISQLSGYLQIDEPDNKSGIKSNPHYPIINSQIESYVYFDSPAVQGGAYHKDEFFFTLDPFEMDSINTLKRTNFNFSGEFESNIFPTFRENLTIRPDYSLGFRRETPPEGYPVYGGKSTFTNTIDLSNKGLKGNGVLNYLTSISHSEDFTFLPDMVKGQVHEFTVGKQLENPPFPDVSSQYIYVEYMPHQDQFYATSQEQNFTMYNQEAQLQGKIKITPYGMTGGGTFYMRSANVKSKDIDFGDHAILADSSDFNLSGAEVEGVSFATTNLISSIDFETRQGTFQSRSGGSRVDFTENRYVSFISEFSWDMDKNDIYMGARGSKGNRFVSTHRRQDSLAFYVPMAMYDVETKTIYAEEVKNIEVGDANLMLNDGMVTIREDAVLDPLDSVRIIIDKDSLVKHTLYDAKVNITGRYEYKGYGKYDYFNGDGKILTLNMHNIEYGKEEMTIAETKIVPQDLFTFDSHFAYQGDARLNAKEQLLTFSGGAQMLHRCSRGPQTYVRFEGPIDPKEVRIPIGEELQNFKYENIYKDFFITKDSTHIYSSFAEDRKDYSDVPMINASGFLVYNSKEQSFDIASASKLANPDTTGTLMRFSEAACNIQGHGAIEMGIDLDQVKTKASGTIVNERDKNDITLSTMLGIDFFFSAEAQDVLYSSILSSSAKASKLSKETFVSRLAEWCGRQQAIKAENDRNATGQGQGLPAELHQLLLFSNIDFEWDTQKRAFVANGKADLAYIKDFVVNREVKVLAEITRKRSGNSLEMYIEFDANTWVYFVYKNSMMQTLSSNSNFNSIVQELKAEDRKQKVGLGERGYTFIMAPESKKKKFVAGFKSSEPAANEEAAEESNGEENNEL